MKPPKRQTWSLFLSLSTLFLIQLVQAAELNLQLSGNIAFSKPLTRQSLPNNPKVASHSSSSSSSSSDETIAEANSLYKQSISLLHALTAHSPPSTSASYSYQSSSTFIPSSSSSSSASSSPPPSSSTSSSSSPTSAILDWLEDSLASSSIRYVRKTLKSSSGSVSTTSLYKLDWSLTATTKRLVEALQKLVGDYSSSSSSTSSSASGSGSSGGGQSRKARESEVLLKQKFQRWRIGDSSNGGGILGVEEVEQGMELVVELLKNASIKGVSEAEVRLGDLYLTGHLTLSPSPKLALQSYTRASESTGNSDAQYKLGFLYGSNFDSATGGEEGVGKQGSALLFYTFSALADHIPSSMTVGYRHWVGIGTKQSCKDALGWYKKAADSAIKTFNAGPPGGRHLPPPKLRLSDLIGGPYGPGASSSQRPHITGGSNSQTLQEWNDLIEWHLFQAEKGEGTFMFKLGRLYYQGFGGGGAGGERFKKGSTGGGVNRLEVGRTGFEDGLSEGGRDFPRAFRWFMNVARAIWKTDGKEALVHPNLPKGSSSFGVGYYDVLKDPKNKVDDHFMMVAGLAAGYIGRMYLRGEGVRVDYTKAYLWFMRGSGHSDRESNNGLGVMWRDGLGVAQDVKKANMLFLAAAQQDLAEAQVNLGKFHFSMGDFALATTYFEHAIRHDGVRSPDTFQAYYYLAELQARALNRNDQCPHAVAFYKVVAERGDWDHEVWWEAERAWGRGDWRTAILGYWIMAERGYEVAQNNLAWILDRDKKRVQVPIIDESPSSNLSDRLALAYWTRSAAQDNVDALVKMGDYYFAGLGVDDGAPQLERAAACYQSAVTSRISAMAMWNLGWMHENGKGVAKDFHLAKRYYDMALETSSDAYLPATLSLISLYARSAYNALFGTDEDLKSLSLFARPPISDDPDQQQAQPLSAAPVQAWSFGKAWREIQRRWGLDPGPEDIPVGVNPPAGGAGGGQLPGGGGGGGGGAAGRTPEQQAREQELADAQRALEANQADDREWARRAGIEDEDEDEFWLLGEGDGDFTGTVAIVILCGILGWLLYFRQGRAADPRQVVPPVEANGVDAPEADPLAGGANDQNLAQGDEGDDNGDE